MRGGWVALGVAALAAAVPACQPPGAAARKASAHAVFYPGRPDPPHIQFLTGINGAADVRGERIGFARFVLGKEQTNPREVIAQPFGLAVWRGKLYVVDHNRGDVLVFDFHRKAVTTLNGDEHIISSPTNLCIDDEGRKFIVEPVPKKIHLFDAQDSYVKTFDLPDSKPTGVAVIGREMFVADGPACRILVIDPATGKTLRTFGAKGVGPGEFAFPSAMARDGEGHLYVADLMNFRFQKLDPATGKALMVRGRPGDSYGSFARPRGLAIGPDGIIYVVETQFELVQMFDKEGKVLMHFGDYRKAPGALEVPAGIAADKSCLPFFQKYADPRFEAEYLVFVASQVGYTKVGVYAFGHLKPGAEVPTNPTPVPPAAKTPPPEKTPGETPPAKTPPEKEPAGAIAPDSVPKN